MEKLPALLLGLVCPMCLSCCHSEVLLCVVRPEPHRTGSSGFISQLCLWPYYKFHLCVFTRQHGFLLCESKTTPKMFQQFHTLELIRNRENVKRKPRRRGYDSFSDTKMGVRHRSCVELAPGLLNSKLGLELLSLLGLSQCIHSMT